jgi:hypothetical protein
LPIISKSYPAERHISREFDAGAEPASPDAAIRHLSDSELASTLLKHFRGEQREATVPRRLFSNPVKLVGLSRPPLFSQRQPEH